MFGKVLIYTNPTRDSDGAITARVEGYLKKNGVMTVTYSDGSEFAQDCTVIVAIGGDGTILRAASISGGRPVLGINAGSIGFMTAFDADECESRLGEVLEGRYNVSEHMLLDVEVLRGGRRIIGATVLNDAVVTGRHVAKTVTLDFLNDGSYMARVRGDGLIAATPTGSTAYSMSAGGPVVDPALEAIILTPVCAHNVSAPSFVLASSSVACIRCISEEGLLITDGIQRFELCAGDEVVVRKSDKSCRLVRLQKYSFYDIINKKLLTGDETMKSLRHDKILEIISAKNVETQEELLDALKEIGIVATQATISRDIKELRLQKTLAPDGGYRYSAPVRTSETGIDSRLQTIFCESVTSVDSAGNMVVIKTLPGLANAACSAVDSMALDYVLGTLAGDDTGIIIVREERYADTLREKFLQLMK